MEAYIAAITPPNVFYIARKLKGQETARLVITELVRALPVCPVDSASLRAALNLPFRDYEDAVQHACASAAHLDAIITRNGADYSGATLPVSDPALCSGAHPGWRLWSLPLRERIGEGAFNRRRTTARLWSVVCHM